MAKKSRTSGFTLVEILVSVMLSGMILTAAYAAFQWIMKSQIRLGGVIDIQRNLFYLNEKLAYLIHNGGTLDYEEYFNRRMLKYDRSFPTNPSAPQVFTFTTASHYGNGSAATKPKIYICWKDASTNNDACLTNAVREKGTSGTFTQSLSGQQAYGQYRELAFNYGSSLPSPTKLPSLFPQWSEIPAGMDKMDTEWLPELYLIKKIPDGSYERVYFRHVFVTDPNRNPSTDMCDPNDAIKKENCLGKIQMTKLKSCDHEKSDGTAGSDGIIDTWIPTPEFSGLSTPIACDGIIDRGNAAKDLIWVDVSSPEMNISKAFFLPSPDKIPGLMAGTGEIATSPTVQLRIEVKLSESLQRRWLLTKESNTPRLLITTFDLPEA